MSTRPRVGVVVLNWNNAGDTIECLQSLRDSDNSVSPIVVDNGSTDGSADLIEQSGLAQVLLREGSNLGYAGGNNVGLKYALDEGFEYIAVLNNDTFVMPGVFESLIDQLAATQSPAAVNPVITYYDDPTRAWFDGGILDRGWPRHLQAHEVGEHRSMLEESELLTGCCIVAHRDIWTRVGFFDPKYFLIFEDSDWSMRAKGLGVRLLVARDCEVRHKVSRSFQSAPMSLLGTFYFVRNGLRFELRYSPRHTLRFLVSWVVRPMLSAWKKGSGLQPSVFAWLGLGAAMAGQVGRAPRAVENLASRFATRHQTDLPGVRRVSDRPLRIAMISYYLPSGSKIGVGYQADQLARALVKMGHEVDVISECPPVAGAPYCHRRIVLTGAMRTFRFAFAIRRFDFSGYDVVHAHGDDYWLWRTRVAAHVRTLHGSCFEEALHTRGAKERLRMVALGMSEVLATFVADQTTAVSPATRRWTPWVCRVIPNGVDLQRFQPDPSSRSPHPVILFVGTWRNRKRGSSLATAFVDEVRPRFPDAELWMVSQDVPPDAGPGITAFGRLSDAELASLYRQAWVFCLPSDYEGFGIPYVEAMASGLPVVATPNIGARYVTADGSAGLLVELDRLGTALADLLNDSGRRQQYSDAGLKRAQEFSLDAIAAQYVDLYRGLQALPRSRRTKAH